MLADFYGTEINNIQVNFQRNREWFAEGKHYYNLEGEERKVWHLLLTQSKQKNVEMRGRSLLLWTQRGVGQHARMINTKEAWRISDMLNDYYVKPTSGTQKRERLFVNESGVYAIMRVLRCRKTQLW